MSSSPLDTDRVAAFVQANQPVTAGEVMFAFQWSYAYTEGALDAMETMLGLVSHVGGYYTRRLTSDAP